MRTVRYNIKKLPPVKKKDLKRIDSIKDEDIDNSDIPKLTNSSKLHPWEDRAMFKPVKVAVTCKLDADIVAWLKQDGKGYQTRMNSILRGVMTQGR